jgi:hypothetical protein
MKHIEPAEAATEVGADDNDMIEGAGVFIWPAAMAVIIATVATLFAWL